MRLIRALTVWAFALGAVGGDADAASPPVLRLESLPQQRVRAAWTNTGQRVAFEETSSLADPVRWQPSPTPVTLDGGVYSAVIGFGEEARFYRLHDQGVNLTRFASSPAYGESGVAVTRETILHFTQPLAGNTLLTTNNLHATFAGRRILSRIEVSSDRRKATLFYLEDLPASARIRVTFDAFDVADAFNRLVDADGDAAEGGVGVIEFDTLSITPVAGTAVIGRVFASHVVPNPTNASASVNLPLAGVTITVDGAEETLRATTDANGFFRLDPSPAGRFFVHIDGRTATNGLPGASLPWTERDYYPVVGKAWETVPGQTNNLAAGTGEIFLPLIKAGTLQAVSLVQDTTIAFPAEVMAANPALDGVHLVVPANALFGDNGVRGGRVGLAAVPPDRIPEPLPPGLSFSLVITVQSDGPMNFDRPVPARFPNLPDPGTGQILSPGQKSALWSFNHDIGEWELAGPMTVTADGRFVVSDPGVGIRQPGWHGSNPACRSRHRKPPPPCQLDKDEKASCTTSVILGAFDCATSFIPGVGTVECLGVNGLLGGAGVARDCTVAAATSANAGQDCAFSFLGGAAGVAASCAVKSIPGFGSIFACGSALINIGLNCTPPCALSLAASRLDVRPAGIGTTPPAIRRWTRVQEVHLALAELLRVTLGTNSWTSLVDFRHGDERAAAEQIGVVLQAIIAAGQVSSAGGSTITPEEQAAILALPRPAQLTATLIQHTVDYINQTQAQYALRRFTHAAAGRTDFRDMDQFLEVLDQLEIALLALQTEGIDGLSLGGELERVASHLRGGYSDSAAPPLASQEIAFVLVDETSGLSQRGRLKSDGNLPLPALRADSVFRLALYEPEGRLYGRISFLTGAPGDTTEIPQMLLLRLGDEAPDADGDGLADEAEFVLGTNPALADSDGDGIRDGAEVAQGTNPLDGRPAVTGTIASVNTAGNAVDVCALNQVAVVADEGGGVVVFDARNPWQPVQTAVVPTPSPAVAVACAGDRAAAALGVSGLGVIDLTTPGSARLLYTLPVGGVARAVAADGNTAFVGNADGLLAVVDLPTGTVRQFLSLARRIDDLGLRGGHLFVATDTELRAFRLGDLLEPAGRVALTGIADTFTGRRRLSVGTTHALVSYQRGFEVIDLQNPSILISVQAFDSLLAGFRQIADNGSGLGVAAASVNARADTLRGLFLYGLAAPTNPPSFLTALPTPGSARAVSVFNGLAYLADGDAGLQVLNFLPSDALRQPPTIAIDTSFPLSNPSNGVAQAGQFVTVTARVSDDVQVRHVEFFVDGSRVVTDGGYPFEQALRTPLRSPTKTTFTLRVQATDTGGNVAFSPEIVVQLQPDLVRPIVMGRHPAANALVGAVNTVLVQFSEPLDPGSLSDAGLALIGAGGDDVLGTPDDQIVTGGSLVYRAADNAVARSMVGGLAAGLYRVQVGSPFSDLSGNVAQSSSWTFRVLGGGDTDQDGLPDALELSLNLNPGNPDSDGDGLPDGDDDLDGDGLPTRWEVQFGLDPGLRDTDSNTVPDASEDHDADALTNLEELAAGTHPRDADTDDDGWNDEAEVTGGGNALQPSVVPSRGLAASPPVRILVLAPGAVEGLGPNTVVGQPPARVLVLAPGSVEGLAPNAVVARPPVKVTLP